MGVEVEIETEEEDGVEIIEYLSLYVCNDGKVELISISVKEKDIR